MNDDFHPLRSARERLGIVILLAAVATMVTAFATSNIPLVPETALLIQTLPYGLLLLFSISSGRTGIHLSVLLYLLMAAAVSVFMGSGQMAAMLVTYGLSQCFLWPRILAQGFRLQDLPLWRSRLTSLLVMAPVAGAVMAGGDIVQGLDIQAYGILPGLITISAAGLSTFAFGLLPLGCVLSAAAVAAAAFLPGYISTDWLPTFTLVYMAASLLITTGNSLHYDRY